MVARILKPNRRRKSSSLTCAFCLVVHFYAPGISGWMPTRRQVVPFRRSGQSQLQAKSEIMDADFERVNPSPQLTDDAALNDEDPSIQSKSLFDMSLESDSYFRNTRIPFLDYNSKSGTGTNYIDVKLAFTAELDGIQYGIAIPFDSAVAITIEQQDGIVEYVSPDLDENEELMSIMAAQLQEHVGKDLLLQRTPRVLTVTGPLSNYTADWQDKLSPDPIETDVLMDKSDEGIDYFLDFMREELGEQEFDKTMNEIPQNDELDEMQELFDVTGLSGEGDIQELMDSLLTPEEDFEQAKASLGLDAIDHEGVALKLVSYIFRDGKSYSLVKLLKPIALVARYIPEKNDARFELLTDAEERIVLPRLEQVCKQDLEKTNLQFKP